jgi:hypothetical protein
MPEVMQNAIKGILSSTQADPPPQSLVILYSSDSEWNYGVPIAGFLLEYPVAYIPSQRVSNPLGNVPLLTYNCLLDSQVSAIRL